MLRSVTHWQCRSCLPTRASAAPIPLPSACRYYDLVQMLPMRHLALLMSESSPGNYEALHKQIFSNCYTGLTQPIRLLARDSNCEHPKLPPRIKL
jgi:hypothetical protein